MDEFEVQILEVNKEEIIRKLETLGAKKTFDGKLHSAYYGFKDDSFKKGYLRLRNAKNGSEFTFKKEISRNEVKIAKEETILLSETDLLLKILNILEFKKLKESIKHRTTYELDKAKFDFDSYKLIPTYLEIESNSIEKVKEFVEKLGFSMKDTNH